MVDINITGLILQIDPVVVLYTESWNQGLTNFVCANQTCISFTSFVDGLRLKCSPQ